MNERTRHLLAGILIGTSTLVAAGTGAQETLVDTVAKGCEKELKEFCAKVTPGEDGYSPACTPTRTSSPRAASMPCTTREPNSSTRWRL